MAVWNVGGLSQNTKIGNAEGMVIHSDFGIVGGGITKNVTNADFGVEAQI